jgi:hypothetical protein
MLNNSNLTTLDQLGDLVEKDKSDHNLKIIGELFLQAANDWPTPNQMEISEFVRELKQFFGTPLTKEKILTKAVSINDRNTWSHEAGTSIVEMLTLAEKFYQLSSFDGVLNKILNFYSGVQKK